MAGESRNGGAQSVDRAVAILDLFLTERRALRLTDIAAAIALTPSTAHRIVRALVAGNLMSQDPLARTYSLGPKVLRLSQSMLSHDYILTVAQPVLVAIRDATGETASLHCRIGDRRLCIAEVVSDQPIRMQSGIGSIYPLTRGAAGKAILAFLPPPFVDAVLSRPYKDGVPSDLLDDLATIQDYGYATSQGETVPGSFAVAVPVSSDERIIGAINVTGPLTRFTDDLPNVISDELMKHADKLGRQLSGTMHTN